MSNDSVVGDDQFHAVAVQFEFGVNANFVCPAEAPGTLFGKSPRCD